MARGRLIRTRQCRQSAVWLGLAFFCLGPGAFAATETLESPALRIELNTNPYSFRVLERSTGDVLVEQSSTAFTKSREKVVSAKGVTKTRNSMEATLALAGTATEAHVAFKFSTPEVIQVILTYGGGNPGEIFEEFKDQGEHYYGIWEYPLSESIDNRGVDHDFFGIGRMPEENWVNARAPFYVTSRKYGIYVETTAKGHYTVAKEGKTSFSFEDSALRYDILYGPSYADIFRRYNAIAGPAFMPPTWAFNSIWWRDDHHADLRGVSNAQEKVIDDADHLAALHIPASAIWLDRPFGTGRMGWGNMDFDASFPNPSKMISDLGDRGMYLLIWVANRTWNNLYDEGSAKGWLFQAPNGPAADMRIPAAYEWFQKKLDAYVRLGVRGYKIDRGEERELPESVENLNAILFPKMVGEGLAAAYGRDYFTFARNANDAARKYTSIWNGDTHSTFGGLQESIKNVQRCGAMNFPMWGSDTGGYIRVPEKELFARWLEFSAYSPMMEVLIGPRRTIWQDYDNELVGIAQEYTRAHHDLIPYTRSYMYQATRTGMPIVRSLIFAYPKDAGLYETWDEYLFGGEILVAPVTAAGATSRAVYLPEGRWMDYNDKATIHQGHASITAKAPLGTIPLFVKEGAIIPRGDILQGNNRETNWKPKLRIELFPSSKLASEFDYYTGTSVQRITASAAKAGIQVKFGDLGAGGVVEIHCSHATGVTRNGARLQEGRDYQYDTQTRTLRVPFTGATALTIRGATSLFGS